MKTYDLYDAYLTYGEIDRLTDSNGNKLFSWMFSTMQESWHTIKHSVATVSEFLQIIDINKSDKNSIIRLKLNPQDAKITYSMLGVMDRLVSGSPIETIETFMSTLMNININSFVGRNERMALATEHCSFIDVSYQYHESMPWFLLYIQSDNIIKLYALELRLYDDNRYIVTNTASTIFSADFETYQVTAAACKNANEIGVTFMERSLETMHFVTLDTNTGSFIQHNVTGGGLLYENLLSGGLLPNIQLRPITATKNYEMYIQMLDGDNMLSIRKLTINNASNGYKIEYNRNEHDTFEHKLTEGQILHASNNQERLMLSILGSDNVTPKSTASFLDSSNLTLLSVSNYNHISELPSIPELSHVINNPTEYFNNEYDSIKLTMYAGCSSSILGNLFKDFSAFGANAIDGRGYVSRFWLNPTYGKMRAYYPDDIRLYPKKTLPENHAALGRIASTSAGIGMLIDTGMNPGMTDFEGYSNVALCLLSDANTSMPTDYVSASTGYVIDQTFARLCYYVDKFNRSIEAIQIVKNSNTGVTVLGKTHYGWTELIQAYVAYPSTLNGKALNRNNLLDNTSSYKGNPLMINMYKEPAYVPTITKRPTFEPTGALHYLSIVPQFGIDTTSKSASYRAGEVINISAITAEGFTFAGWYSDDLLVSPDSTMQITMPDNNVTLHASAILNDDVDDLPGTEDPETPDELIILTLDKMIGIENVIGAGTYPVGERITVRASVKSGYRFLGWYLGSKIISSSAQFTYVTPNTDVTLYAMATLV